MQNYSCIIFVPVDVVKERLQVQRKVSEVAGKETTLYRGSYDAIRTIFKDEGLMGIYRGYGATLFAYGPFSAFYFLFYEQVFVSNLL